jgi:hypothetical protein
MKLFGTAILAAALVLAVASPARSQLKVKTFHTKVFGNATAARASANAWISDYSKHGAIYVHKTIVEERKGGFVATISYAEPR